MIICISVICLGRAGTLIKEAVALAVLLFLTVVDGFAVGAFGRVAVFGRVVVLGRVEEVETPDRDDPYCP